MATVAIYVQRKYAKQAYKVESYNVRRWAGIEMIRHSIERQGATVGYCDFATVGDFDVVLVSMTAICDWWTFIAEQATWKTRPIVIVGGCGVLNIRPVLPYFDIAVFGRGENIIAPLLDHVGRGVRYEHPSVCYADGFSPDQTYRIAQADQPYPHSIDLPEGNFGEERGAYLEESIGCARRCYFCAYSWHRRRSASVGANSYGSGGSREITMLDLDMENPQTWDVFRNIGLDGTSERLRRMANKKITRDLFQRMLTNLRHTTHKPHQIKAYCVVGYPTETQEDWAEHLEDLKIADSAMDKADKQWPLVLMASPLRPMPCTPSAYWSIPYKNHRGAIAKALKSPKMPGNVYFQGENLWAVESMGTESLSSIILELAIIRGVEDDTDPIRKIATSKRYWNANAKDKQATAESVLDVGRLFSEYSLDDLPARYLESYIPNANLYAMGQKSLKAATQRAVA